MKKHLVIYFALVALCIIATSKTFSQNNVKSLVGPRLGGTIITGKLADKLKDDYDASPIITQFGWQFEWRFFTTQKNITGVVEVVPLIGGVEQNLFIPSVSSLVGIRTGKGFEFGIGPNVSVTGASIVFAIGTNFSTGEINWPINFAIVPSKDSFRFTLLFGFNVSRNDD